MYNLHTRKQVKYFDEVIKLYYENGYSKEQISRLLSIGHTTVCRWISEYAKHKGDVMTSPGVKSHSDLLETVRSLYESGTSPTAMSRITGLSRTTIYKWIAIFAKEKEEATMKREKEATISSLQEEPSSGSDMSIEELKAKLKATEEALHRAELRADLYDEMINVAEAKFKIGIRKKAGAKQ